MAVIGIRTLTIPPTPHWHCFQIGAREHYAIPRAVQRSEATVSLHTDFWARRPYRNALPRRLREKRHAELTDDCVYSPDFRSIVRGLCYRASGESLWQRIQRDDEWFGRWAARKFRRRVNSLRHLGGPDQNSIIFAYSYAARHVLKVAREFGIPSILGQIDPGPVEMRLVQKLEQDYGLTSTDWPRQEYWDNWSEECELADAIVVNSEWSKKALEKEGVPAAKLNVIPLAYETKVRPTDCPKNQNQRPLRVLFLGQVLLRKGIRELTDAIQSLRDRDVHWDIVGGGTPELISELRQHSSVTVHGSVSRAQCATFYQQADVFILPTHSDGFAITQLESLSYGTPVIASKYCGDVVKHDSNGLTLDQVSGPSIARAITRLLDEPGLLNRLRVDAIASPPDFSIDRLSRNLLELSERLTQGAH